MERQREAETVQKWGVTRQGLSGTRGLGQYMERDELVCTLQGIVCKRWGSSNNYWG